MISCLFDMFFLFCIYYVSVLEIDCWTLCSGDLGYYFFLFCKRFSFPSPLFFNTILLVIYSSIFFPERTGLRSIRVKLLEAHRWLGPLLVAYIPHQMYSLFGLLNKKKKERKRKKWDRVQGTWTHPPVTEEESTLFLGGQFRMLHSLYLLFSKKEELH